MPFDAFGEHSLSWTAVFEWHSHFKANQVSVEDDELSGRPGTSKMTENVEKFENSSKDCCRINHELADTTGICYGVCQEILTENLNMCCIASSARQHTLPRIPENHKVCD
jgi:hypothetical protein